MSPSDKPQLAALLVGLAETYGRKLTEAGLKIYWLGLQDVELVDVATAVGELLQESKFMPTVAEIRSRCGTETAEIFSVRAWQAVCDAIGNVGSYRAVDFEDATINATIRNLGGWPEILSRSGDEFDKWTRQEFLKTYRALYGRVSRDSELGRPLAGLGTKPGRPCFVAVEYQINSEIRRLPSNQTLQLTTSDSTRLRSIGDVLKMRFSERQENDGNE